jgi:hypothetical protein
VVASIVVLMEGKGNVGKKRTVDVRVVSDSGPRQSSPLETNAGQTKNETSAKINYAARRTKREKKVGRHDGEENK